MYGTYTYIQMILMCNVLIWSSLRLAQLHSCSNARPFCRRVWQSRIDIHITHFEVQYWLALMYANTPQVFCLKQHCVVFDMHILLSKEPGCAFALKIYCSYSSPATSKVFICERMLVCLCHVSCTMHTGLLQVCMPGYSVINNY